MKKTKYSAKQPDSAGIIKYTESENKVWNRLYRRQIECIKHRACNEFLAGMAKLQLVPDQISQCKAISDRLTKLTGWSVVPVEALISFEEFFTLLSNKQFPAASFIRVQEELDYLQEPDIFHEIFGHCPMLAHPEFSAFTHRIGQLGVSMSKENRRFLARLYWFTAEFGLINTKDGLRIYGGGILSSYQETQYALESNRPLRIPFDLMTVLRTPYRYDEMQLTYFIINDFATLYHLLDKKNISAVIEEAKALGMLPSRYDSEQTDQRSC